MPDWLIRLALVLAIAWFLVMSARGALIAWLTRPNNPQRDEYGDGGL
jgi:hypothetical protein